MRCIVFCPANSIVKLYFETNLVENSKSTNLARKRIQHYHLWAQDCIESATAPLKRRNPRYWLFRRYCSVILGLKWSVRLPKIVKRWKFDCFSHRLPGHLHGTGTRGTCTASIGTVYERGRLGAIAELSFGTQLHGWVVGYGMFRRVFMCVSIGLF